MEADMADLYPKSSPSSYFAFSKDRVESSCISSTLKFSQCDLYSAHQTHMCKAQSLQVRQRQHIGHFHPFFCHRHGFCFLCFFFLQQNWRGAIIQSPPVDLVRQFPGHPCYWTTPEQTPVVWLWSHWQQWQHLILWTSGCCRFPPMLYGFWSNLSWWSKKYKFPWSLSSAMWTQRLFSNVMLDSVLFSQWFHKPFPQNTTLTHHCITQIWQDEFRMASVPRSLVWHGVFREWEVLNLEKLATSVVKVQWSEVS